jgi:hypothetical protein
VKIVAFLESMIPPRLHNAAKYVVDILDNKLAVANPILEKELRVQGRFPTGAPPTILSVDNIGVQVVPPVSFVRRTFPGFIVRPVFESTANTLRRTILSDILLFLPPRLKLIAIKRLYFSRESFAQSDDARRGITTTCGSG